MSIEKIDALEERISRVVAMVKGLKEEKTRLEGEVARMRDELEELARLRQEKDVVKNRLEKILKGIEELAP